MEIKFSNDEVKKIVLEYALNTIKVEFDEAHEMVCKLDGYSSYNVTATVSIEKREPEPLKAVA
jgi:hypothetical protein